MAVFAMTSAMPQLATAWTGTSPGNPGTQTISGTLTTPTDVSAMCVQVSVSFEADELEYTNFASGGWRQKLAGLKSGMVQFDFNQDYAASQVDALFGLGGTFGFGTTFYTDIKPTNSARSATNPSTVLQILNLSYTPIAGKVGDLAVVSLQFPFTGQPGRLVA